MKGFLVLVLLLIADGTALAQSVLPLDVELYERRDVVSSRITTLGRTAVDMPPGEFGEQSLQTTEIDWNGIRLDTVTVGLTSRSQRARTIDAVVYVDVDDAINMVSRITDVISQAYDRPTSFEATFARWERGDEALISIGIGESDERIWLRFDLEALNTFLPETKPLWPLNLAMTSDREDVRSRLSDSCHNVTAIGETLVSTGCVWYGRPVSTTMVVFSPNGHPQQIEQTIKDITASEVEALLGRMYGPPTAAHDGRPTWMAEDRPAVSVTEGDAGGRRIIYDLRGIEKLQILQRRDSGK
ncbi:MAG TPA: hypothetical protein DIS79_09595 [Bacteroidetes bacterium]|nr:hypothetical protein [Bacteroidota bacterium]HRK05567.1 hypothetical protein [Chlorobiota bacterium]